ncbi:MAG: acyl-CoA dehydrogenase family protein [Oceanicoccus sp.]
MTDSDSLLKTAEELSKEFYERSDEIEKTRRIPADISKKIGAAGFYRLGIPRHIGGLEAPPALSSRIFETLARGDASCAWVAFIGATTGTSLASIPEETATEIFSAPEVLMTGVFAPTGVAEKVDGGFRVTGNWQWGSGSQNADWLMGGCMLKENGEAMLDGHGRPRSHPMIMPKKDVEFVDTWHVSGLRGTGSLDYRVKDLFIPQDRVVAYLQQDKPPGPLYAFPYFTFLALGIGAVCLGIARAAIDELIELAKSKKRSSSSKTVAEQQISQMKLAQAEADLRSARLFYYDALDEAWQRAVEGEEVSLEMRRNLRLATTNAVIKSAEVVDVMYSLGGGSAVYQKSRLQRHFRDVHVATSHIMVAPSTLETVGRLLFGLETNTAMF